MVTTLATQCLLTGADATLAPIVAKFGHPHSARPSADGTTYFFAYPDGRPSVTVDVRRQARAGTIVRVAWRSYDRRTAHLVAELF